MSKLRTAVSLGFGITALFLGTAAAQISSILNPTDGIDTVHIMPTPDLAAILGIGLSGGPLLYHSGGSVMGPGPVNTYAIFWVPASGKLQNGNATGMTAHYKSIQELMLEEYPAHGIDNNNTQYYQTIGSVTSYIRNSGGLAGVDLDTDAYPPSGCTDTATPGNCISDAQIRTEIKKVMTARGWTGGLNKMFLLYTSSGEGSCFNSSSCAYTQYCAYHGHISGSPEIIYGNEPYGDLTNCSIGKPSPNGDPLADVVASIASHELTEAITDPLLNAWFDSSGNEIGDLCNFNYGTNTWDGSPAKANQMWGGYFFELQQQWDNHKGGCVQVGP